MTTHTFNTADVLAKGWDKTKKHLWFLVLTTLVLMLVASLLPIKDSFLLRHTVTALLALAWSSVVLAIIHDKKPRIHDLTKHFASYHKPLQAVVLSIIISVLTLLGLMLLVIPGIYIALRFSFSPFYVIEHEHKTIGESLEEIFALTKGNVWNLFLFWFAAVGINILGFLAFGVGLLVTIPLTGIAYGYIYKALTPHHKR